MLRTALLILAIAPLAQAQWNEIDRSQPYALEACASVNYQLERWETAVLFLERITEERPDDPFAALWLARSLTDLNQREAAVVACERASEMPAVRAEALLHLARNYAASGESEAALQALAEAARAQLVDRENLLEQDPAFSSLRSSSAFREVREALSPLPQRLRALSNAGDRDGLVALFYACTVLVDPGDVEPSDLVLGELRESIQNPKTRDENDNGRLRLIAKAVDATIEGGRMADYVDAWLGWSPDEIAAEKQGWSVLRSLGSMTRSHRFDDCIEKADAHAREAKARGDLLQLYHARIAASICHLAVRDYRQPRRGVAAAEESRLGTEKILEALEIARGLGIVSGVVDCLDYLASHEVHSRTMADDRYDQVICEATALSGRLIPKARELGMWEQLWRTRRGGEASR